MNGTLIILAVAYIVAYILLGALYIAPWLSTSITGLLQLTLWQIIGIILYFTVGLGFVITAIWVGIIGAIMD